MRRLDADFRRQHGMPVAWGALVLGALLIACVGQAALAVKAAHRAEAKLAQARLLQSAQPRPPEPPAEALPHANDAAAMARMAAFDWSRAVAPLLSARVEGVVATSLSIDAQAGTGSLVIEASRPEALHAYESALRQGEPAGIWRLRGWATSREPAVSATFELRPDGRILGEPSPQVPQKVR